MMTDRRYNRTFTGLLALVIMAVAAAATAGAQTDPQARLVLRPLSMDDIANGKLPADTQRSGGLTTIGLGQPAYLDALVNVAVSPSDLGGVTWTLTNKPATSKADLEDSPLGTDLPIYEPSDRVVSQLAGRKMLRPDVTGRYTVTASISIGSAGTKDASITITAGTYLGINACSKCHKDGPDGTKWSMVKSWQKTGHSVWFKNGINGVLGSYYSAACLPCHTVGFDPNPKAVNGGFDDVAAQLKWTFPAVLKPDNWDAVPDALKNLGNIQCENCHGPGSEHVAGGGDRTAISVSFQSGDCGQCHGAAPHHVKSAEWGNSKHAAVTNYPSGAGHEECVGCHTGSGFVDRIKGVKAPRTDYAPINCQTCHEPHGRTTPDNTTHLVRTVASVQLMDGTTLTDGGKGMLCMNCHHSRANAAEYAVSEPASPYFGPHHGPQADMLAGVNGFTYGRTIPSSAHGSVVEDTCVTCHMQNVEATDAAFAKAGGHTFKPGSEDAGDLVGACQKCHGPRVDTFDFPLLDYDGDGVIDGAQTEVQHLLDQLSMLLPPVGQAKTALAVDATWTRAQLQGAYNWKFVKEDGSHGIHNMAYAVGLLKTSIADLKSQK